jgi:hypothetical protein
MAQKNSLDIEILGLVETHDILENWIKKCTNEQQLILMNNVVDDFITKKRFPHESSEAINIASLSLHLSINSKFNDLVKQFDHESRTYQLSQELSD